MSGPRSAGCDGVCGNLGCSEDCGEPTTVRGDAACADLLARLRRDLWAEPGLGCSLVAHRDLGFCSSCHRAPGGWKAELNAWRLLAMAERGIPPQPWEKEVPRET